MGGLYGPLGGLDELPCATTLANTPTGALVLSDTEALSGRVWSQSASVMPNREWAVSVGTARPEAAAILDRIASRQITNARPCIFYPEPALVNNVLDPAASLMSTHRWQNIIPVGSQVRPVRSEHPPVVGVGRVPPGWRVGAPVEHPRPGGTDRDRRGDCVPTCRPASPFLGG